jgi:erythrin-vacuolar iron transport family protein
MIAMTAATIPLVRRWRAADERQRLLQIVQPALIGLIDGTISTLAPIFAAAYIAGSQAALLVGLAAALGAAISMGMSEGLSDDGEITGRGASLSRGMITGLATFVGGTAHALPFLISDVSTALTVAYIVVSVELVAIAWVRKRFLGVALKLSLIQVTLGGAIVAGVGILVGHA